MSKVAAVMTWAAAILVVTGGDGVAAEPVAGNKLCPATSSFRPGTGQVWGYMGDGSAVMDAKPPLRFDLAKEPQRLAWKTALPKFGSSSPIVVGDRVFVLCEPRIDQPWPELLCLSMTDGKELWRYALNHLPATGMDAEQQKQAQQLWADFWRKSYTLFPLRDELLAATKTDPARRKSLLDELHAKGITLIEKPGVIRMDPVELNTLGRAPYNKAFWTVDTWARNDMRTGANGGSYYIGEAFPTPVSDGTHIYAVTAYGGFFCLDLDGKAKWIRHYPGVFGEYCRNGRSPIIWKNLLLCDTTAMMRGIDLQTGALKWSGAVDGETILTPTVVRTKNGDAVICGHGDAFRLPDGGKLKVEEYKEFGMTAVTKYDEPDVVFFTGGGEHGGWEGKGKCATPPPSAVRFDIVGDVLKANVLWSGINGQPKGGHQRLVYHEGRLYTPGVGVIDAGSGKLLAAATSIPSTGHLLFIANGHVLGVNQENVNSKGQGVTQLHYRVTTCRGDVVGDSVVPGYNYASAFTVSGSSLLVRTSTHLWCIR